VGVGVGVGVGEGDAVGVGVGCGSPPPEGLVTVNVKACDIEPVVFAAVIVNE